MEATMQRRLLLVLVFVWLLPTSVWAVDPDKRLTQYAHVAWRMQDGAINSAPNAIVQTPDGYIWIGTSDGVLQFDGVRFVQWTPGRGQRLPSSQALRFKTTRDGSVWITGFGTLSRWKNHTLTNYASGAATEYYAVDEDGEQRIWATRYFARDGSPLCQVLETGLRCDAPLKGTTLQARVLLAERDGTLWIGGDTGVLRWSQGTQTAYRPAGLASSAGIPGVSALAASPNGTLWVGFRKPGPGLGLQRIADGRWQSFDTPTFHGSSLLVGSLFVDRDGVLWVGTLSRGLYRVHGDVVDHFDRANGLSDDAVYDLTQDREGSIWVVTARGVDRFADAPVTSVSVADGLCMEDVTSLLASRDGSIWVGGNGTLTRFHDGGVTCLRTGRELPGYHVESLFEDHAGQLWVGIDQGLWVYEHGRFQPITRPDKGPIGLVTAIDEDTDQSIWIAVFGPPPVLMRIDGLVVRQEFGDPATPRRVAADPTGGLWLGLFNGDLAHFRDGQTTVHRFKHPQGALVRQLLSLPDGSILAATTYGLIGWFDGKASTLSQKNGLPCEQVYSMAFDHRGDLWLYMSCALGVLKKADLQAWKQNPDAAVAIRTLGGLDGVQPVNAGFHGAATSLDGRLWFSSGALQFVDPEGVGRNRIPPPVYIEQVIADGTAYPSLAALRLPPLTHNLEIDYVGLSFVVPQKVRFRYRLDGRDDTWQEPVDRRQAFYNDLRPGTYRFHVVASNNDGVWNEDGASVEIVIAPAWYQTRAFLTFMIALAGIAAWLTYRLRLRQVARALNARFNERLDERTRVARDLHDTLLQTVQGSKMVADSALDRPDDAAALARALQQVSAWLAQAGHEGRAAVNALRLSTTERNDLAEAFCRAIDDCRRQRTIDGDLTVTGDPKEMHPVVRDEIYRIGYEAIRNACMHSRGSRLDVGLDYGRDLTLRIADDGVGMEPAVADSGKDGRFGLLGMRERAGRIGASLSVNSVPDKGTVVVVSVPGQAIFRDTRTPFAGKLWSRLAGTGETPSRRRHRG